jgi:hypothetical protein
MGIIGWGTITDQANTTTGGAANTVADVSTGVSTGFGLGGLGLVNTYSAAPPVPPFITGFLVLEDGFENYLLQESGTPPLRFELE